MAATNEERLSTGHKKERTNALFAFDIEGTGANRSKDQLISFGWTLDGKEGGQVTLYLRRSEKETWRQLWERSGFEMRCYDEFWSKNITKLQAMQIPVYEEKYKDESGFVYWRFYSIDGMRLWCDDIEDGEIVVIESSNAVLDQEAQMEWKSQEFDEYRKKFTPVFYVRVYNEKSLAQYIHDILKQKQQDHKLTYVSDTLHYDASWVDMLLVKHGYMPLLHDQSETPGFKYMYWGRELGSYQMGICGATTSDGSKEQYDKTKRFFQAQITNGWKSDNAHFAVDDALGIAGAWDVAESFCKQRVALDSELASVIRSVDEGFSDKLPNWAVVLFWLRKQDNKESLKELILGSKKQRKQ